MKIDPNWVAGFVDGEGTFYVGVNKNPTMKSGYQVLPEFRIVQHKKDIQLLYALKRFFGTGVVRVNHDDRYEIRIRNLDKLAVVIVPFFKKHQLHTQKKFDFIRFAKIISLMVSDEHLKSEGILKIIDIASKMNRADKIKTLETRKEIENRIVI
jgi:hypothetical protein